MAVFSSALKAAGFIGDVDITYSGRLIAATDNSIYQQIPQAVIYPKSQNDVACLLRVANRDEFQHLKFAPRGGGTGTNGQSLTPNIVIDLSRHLTRVLELNEKEGWVKVESGIVKDALNEFLAPYGYFFAPDTSTSNRCTIGGMIATDASGQGSIVYGKTSDHVLGLRSFLVSGNELNTHPIPLEDAKKLAEDDSVEGLIYRQAIASCVDMREEVEAKFPPLNRFLTGYDLKHTWDPESETIDLSRVIAGAEGTLSIVTEAKLNITPIPKHKVLVNIQYSNFESALRHAPELMKAEATSVETIDSNVLELARNDIIWNDVADLVDSDTPMNGINMVEYTALTAEEIDHKLDWLKAHLSSDSSEKFNVCGFKVCSDIASIQRVYAMRKKAVGLLGAMPGKKKPIAFVEDTAVPPEKLADYILEFRALLDEKQLQYGMFGHVDAGVLHVRPALDMTDTVQEKLVREISDKVMALTAKYGGLMWGEHGKGYRSEYGPEFFGEKLFLELRKIKSSFDPNNRLNPGKICTPVDSDASLVSVDGQKRGVFDKEIPVEVRESYQGAMDCNGNGLCFSFDVNTPMCPSYRAYGNRKESPKGRATLIKEWLRVTSLEGYKADELPKQKAWPIRAINSVNKPDDFNTEIKEAMDSCLACKACSTQCPVKVDIPTQRTKFYRHYYSRYLRPMKDILVKNSEKLLPRLSKFPRLANVLMHNPISHWVQRHWLGYIDTPRFAFPTAQQLLATSKTISWNELQKRSQASGFDATKYVAVVPDVFTLCFEPEVMKALVDTATKLGKTPVFLPFQENGKGLHVKGYVEEFYQTALTQSQLLNSVAKLNVEMVGLDAATTLCYRDEYTAELGSERGDFQVQLIQEWLVQQDLTVFSSVSKGEEAYTLLTHCTEQTKSPTASKTWQQIFTGAGISLNTANNGCCGMAGSYGHESDRVEASRRIFDLSWKPILEQNNGRVVATGFSCRCQSSRFGAASVKHPLVLFAEHFSS
ncbi:FAD-binding oxidoreductase [Lysobacter sp. N42]|nr:FAD-binding oxidoreductase [Aliidiomarina sp. B3213]TCZ93434.1 FAD-binding oxidoreductase [Lysobacter sp. N42]